MYTEAHHEQLIWPENRLSKFKEAKYLRTLNPQVIFLFMDGSSHSVCLETNLHFNLYSELRHF